MNTKKNQTFADVPQLDYGTILSIEIGRSNHNSDSVEIKDSPKNSVRFTANRLGKDGMSTLVKQIRAAAAERNVPYFTISSGSTWTSDNHVFYFNAPKKIKKLTDAQKRALSIFAKKVYNRAWYAQYGLIVPKYLKNNEVQGEKAAANIKTLRKLCEYGLIEIESGADSASLWKSFSIKEAGLAYVEANMPEDTKAARFEQWDKIERQAIKREDSHVTNHVICAKIADGFKHIELGKVGSDETDPFYGTKFKWVFGGRTYVILHSSKVEVVTESYNERFGKSSFIKTDEALVYAKALQAITELAAEIAKFKAANES